MRSKVKDGREEFIMAPVQWQLAARGQAPLLLGNKLNPALISKRDQLQSTTKFLQMNY